MIDLFVNALHITPETVYEKRIVVRGKGVRVKVSETVHGKPIFRTQYPKARVVDFEKQTSATWKIVSRKTGLVIREIKALYYIGRLYKDGKPLLTKKGKHRSGIITWKKAEK